MNDVTRCNVMMQNEVAAALVDVNIPVFAWKGEIEEDFWWCIEQVLVADNWQPNMVRPSFIQSAVIRYCYGNRCYSNRCRVCVYIMASCWMTVVT